MRRPLPHVRRPLACAGVAALVTLSLPLDPASASGGQAGSSPFTTTGPQLATITAGSSTAPWNASQGDPSSAPYGASLPTYTPPSSGVPNLAVYPGATSGTAGNSPYPSGVVGSPGMLAGYCGTGTYTAAAAASPNRQPTGTTLPFSPAYFPHVVRNADGSLTGYFDERPKDADESIVAARSTDGGHSWTYQSQALEQNPGYCPVGDINDDGQGHPQVLTIGGVTRLYTLQRAAGDSIGVGLTVHTLSPTASNPLAGAPATEAVGIDANTFTTAPASVGSSATTIPVVGTGTVGSPQRLLAGGFVDLTQTPVPTAASVITCTGVTATSLTGCTSPSSVAVASGDLVEQVMGTVSSAVTVPTGPNKTDGSGGVNVSVSFLNSQIGTLFNANAPNRAYVDGVPVYCAQANANPITTAMQNCTTKTGTSSLAAAVGDPVTSDPIQPAGAQMTTGLDGPDGIVGVLPSYPGLPGGTTAVLYTQKYAGFYIAGKLQNSAAVQMTATPFTLTFAPSPFTGLDLPATISSASPVTVYLGDQGGSGSTATKTLIAPVTCTGFTTGSTDSLTGCTVPAAYQGDFYPAFAMVGAPGATTVDAATLAKTGQGSPLPVSEKNIAKLFKNNEDLTVLRVAYTTDGLTFSTVGLHDGGQGPGVISGESGGASTYGDLSNPAVGASPANLNDPNAPTSNELRWIGSAGTITSNPDGTIGLFLSGAWAADGDSDAYNRVIYATSADGEHWSVPTTVVDTDYTFADSIAQEGTTNPLGIGAYYEGRAYGPSVVPNTDGTLTMLFADVLGSR